MSNVAIKVENLSKAYQIGQIGTSTVSRDLERWWITKALGREDPFLKIGETNDRSTKGESDVVWSLKNINLEVEQGDVVGIIGKNGAGKSTLLKLLSRITAPTSGKIKLKGRVASLLEVGTGFHPELTGRENIYLNGSILGMRKKEIDRKLNEIIDFSSVERYIDTPVKRYSSGMYVRLAFAVAAHLESEILIVDEVLAVGDAEFQKKCLGQMSQIAEKQGKTILFVSHNMSSIKNLCNRCITLNNGSVIFEGNVNEAIDLYLSNDAEVAETGIIPLEMKRNYGSDRVKFTKVQIFNYKDSCEKQFYYGEPLKILIDFLALDKIESFAINIIIGTLDGQHIVYSEINSENSSFSCFEKGHYNIAHDLDAHLLPGNYSIYLGFSLLNGETLDWVERVYDFQVTDIGFDKNFNYRWRQIYGFVLDGGKISISKLSNETVYGE